MDQIEQYLKHMSEAIYEIDEMVDDRVDIDNNGNANIFMKIKMETDKLQLHLKNLKEELGKDLLI